ncbi:MAG: hypothetical protein WD271_17110 [Acidimicrobiia bacterium]
MTTEISLEGWDINPSDDQEWMPWGRVRGVRARRGPRSPDGYTVVLVTNPGTP